MAQILEWYGHSLVNRIFAIVSVDLNLWISILGISAPGAVQIALATGAAQECVTVQWPQSHLGQRDGYKLALPIVDQKSGVGFDNFVAEKIDFDFPQKTPCIRIIRDRTKGNDLAKCNRSVKVVSYGFCEFESSHLLHRISEPMRIVAPMIEMACSLRHVMGRRSRASANDLNLKNNIDFGVRRLSPNHPVNLFSWKITTYSWTRPTGYQPMGIR